MSLFHSVPYKETACSREGKLWAERRVIEMKKSPFSPLHANPSSDGNNGWWCTINPSFLSGRMHCVLQLYLGRGPILSNPKAYTT